MTRARWRRALGDLAFWIVALPFLVVFGGAGVGGDDSDDPPPPPPLTRD